MGKTIRGKDKKTKQRIIISMQPKNVQRVRFSDTFNDLVEEASNRGKPKFYNVNE